MIESSEGLESLDDVEILLRSAMDYVCPSDELRPRILEAARSECREQRVLDYLRSVAVCLVALGMLAAALRQSLESVETHPSGILSWVAFNGAFSTGKAIAPGNDASWENVDSFTELRRRQAEILRLAQ